MQTGVYANNPQRQATAAQERADRIAQKRAKAAARLAKLTSGGTQ